MHVMITGGMGFIGSALSRSLLADGHHVYILTRNPQRARVANSTSAGPGAGAQVLGWDGRTCDGWLDVFTRMDAIVNLAGATIGSRSGRRNVKKPCLTAGWIPAWRSVRLSKKRQKNLRS